MTGIKVEWLHRMKGIRQLRQGPWLLLMIGYREVVYLYRPEAIARAQSERLQKQLEVRKEVTRFCFDRMHFQILTC